MSKKVCLIDGSGYIFRAFYALPPLTSPSGTPVNAVLGFLNMFMRLTAKIPCDYCLVLFDAKRQNFRNSIFPPYKGTRRETPVELIAQFPLIRQAVDILNLNHLETEGFEADDLIATYAREAVDKGYEVSVVSADKDLMQLIRPHVEFYDGMKDKFFTPEDVKEKFGVYPDKVVDVQALAGDSIDNVPGVAGIGLKTASELVNRFGSLSAVLERATEITQNKRRETLLAHIDDAKISEQLVRLKDDIPDLPPVETYECRVPHKEQVLSFIREHGLKSLENRATRWVEDQTARCSHQLPEVKKEHPKNYRLITSMGELNEAITLIREARRMAFKFETDGINEDLPIGLSFAVGEGNAFYVPFSREISSPLGDLFSAPTGQNGLTAEMLIKVLEPILLSRSILKISYEIKDDLHILERYLGKQVSVFPIDDVAVMAYVADGAESGNNLSTLALKYTDYQMISAEDLFGQGRKKLDPKDIEPEKMLAYTAEKSDIILRLADVLKQRLFQEKLVSIYEDFDRPLIGVLKNMETNGIRLNTQALCALDAELSARAKDLEQEIYAMAGETFNLSSPKQIGEILYEKIGLKGKKHTSGSFQTGAEVLERLAEEHPLPEKILQWRTLAKLQSTYTGTLPTQMDAEQRVHTTFRQTVVNTGRLASANPNLQNIPIRSDTGKKIRACFVARAGYKLIAADYSQVELRLLAEVADVKALKEAFLKGTDIHALTASRVFGVPQDQVDSDLRRHAKAINFGIVYGISAYGLAKQIDQTPEAAKRYIDAYFSAMPEIKTYMEQTIEYARRNGFVQTPNGRKCVIAGINNPNKRLASFAERAAINAPIQGGAADIIKRAMIEIDEALKTGGYKTKMLLQVHDELVFEAPEDEAQEVAILIKNKMENVVHFDIPFVAETGIGDNWAEAH